MQPPHPIFHTSTKFRSSLHIYTLSTVSEQCSFPVVIAHYYKLKNMKDKIYGMREALKEVELSQSCSLKVRRCSSQVLGGVGFR